MNVSRFASTYRPPSQASVQPRAPMSGGTYGTLTRRPSPGMNSASPYGYQRPGSMYGGQQRQQGLRPTMPFRMPWRPYGNMPPMPNMTQLPQFPGRQFITPGFGFPMPTPGAVPRAAGGFIYPEPRMPKGLYGLPTM